jgi:hypothetical protein
MNKIIPTLVFGNYLPGDWISRYSRFRVDLPAGSHRLVGRTYNPAGEDLEGSELIVVIGKNPIGEIRPHTPPQWSAFALDLPELAAPSRVNILLHSTRFRLPPPPDQRILGLILDDFYVLLQD